MSAESPVVLDETAPARDHGKIERMHWHQQLGFLLDDVAHLYARRFEKHAPGLSLTLHQCKALAVLANCEGINQRRPSETSDIVPTDLLRILARLEAGRLVRAAPRPPG